MSTKSNPWSGPETTGSGAACTNPTGEVQSPFQRSGASTGEKTYNHRLLSANSDPGSALPIRLRVTIRSLVCDWMFRTRIPEVVADATRSYTSHRWFGRGLNHASEEIAPDPGASVSSGTVPRSEERRVGKECRSRWRPEQW